MKSAWIILVISALTDFGIVVAAGLVSAMMATGQATMPNQSIVVLNLLIGLGAFLRTIQQALKNTPETAAVLKGSETTTKTLTIEKTP